MVTVAPRLINNLEKDKSLAEFEVLIILRYRYFILIYFNFPYSLGFQFISKVLLCCTAYRKQLHFSSINLFVIEELYKETEKKFPSLSQFVFFFSLFFLSLFQVT